MKVGNRTKEIGYRIVAFWFAIFRILPVKEDRVFMIASHDDSPDGNIGMTAEALRKKGNFHIAFMTKADGIHHPFHFFIWIPYMLARAKYIFMDNNFLPMAYLNFSKKTKIIQLWHGTGTVKKFGQDTNTGKIKKLEYRANRRITHLIVNSAYTKKQYAKAFGIDESRVYILGLPRSDLYLNKERLKEKANRFYAAYPELKQKRLILYAPTFRDQSKDQMEQEQRLHKLPEGLGENDVILFRLHPHVAGRVSNNIPEKYKGKQYNMSNYKEPAALLAVSDILITDYSSIIFEYCLLDKPILFYAYDYEQFEAKGRSFYEDYRKYVPGKVVMTEKELWEALRECGEHSEQVKAFKEKSFRYLDGKSVERLLQEILK